MGVGTTSRNPNTARPPQTAAPAGACAIWCGERRSAIVPTDVGDTASILTTQLAGLQLRNPVILAAGTAGYLDEMADVLDLSLVGGVVTKSITRLPREGNATWRILPARAGMLNAIGLANVGIDHFAREIAPRISSTPCAVIGSIAGYSIDDYVAVAATMDDIESLRAVELNVSCPNVHGGCEFGADPKLLGELIGAIRPVLAHTRLFVKLSPVAVAVAGIGAAELARAAIEGAGKPSGPNKRPGADAICLTNTIPAMAIDVRTRKPRLANVTGGLSGPAAHPVALKIVYDVHRLVAKQTQTPIIGIGGVMGWEDAAEFILAGATAVEIGTGLFADPLAPRNVVRGLMRWVRDSGAASIGELVGAVKV
jgi:dihydroorotate dehydrogenase (NAD+) catalytic subunit